MAEMDVLFLTKYDRKGASSRYRTLQYFPAFEDAGIRCTHAPLFSDAYLEELYETESRPVGRALRRYAARLRDLLRVRQHDVVVLEKELLPYVPAVFERMLGRYGPPLIVDYDDAIFHTYDRAESPLIRRLLGEKIDVVMRSADAVVAGNGYLASRAHDAGASRVEIIPTVIDLDRYPNVPPKNQEPFTIGWIGSPTTARYVKAIAPALREVCDRRNARVVTVGARDLSLRGLPHENRAWSEETEIDDVASFDVGIMPLEETPWEQGKCGFKLIQYMGCAKPVVASPVGVNADIAKHEVSGFHATSIDEWVASLVYLCDDRALAREMGRRGRQRVGETYCLEATAPVWTRLLLSFRA